MRVRVTSFGRARVFFPHPLDVSDRAHPTTMRDTLLQSLARTEEARRWLRHSDKWQIYMWCVHQS